ncbi:MAG TPA: hypothetical protein VGC24_08670 [Burkholderiaceae bacterium]
MTQAGDDVLAPRSCAVPFRGETLVLTPLRLEQLPAFITATRSIIGRVALAAGLLDTDTPVHAGAVLLDLLEQDARAFSAALAVVTGRDEAWIAGGEVDHVAALVEAVVTLNIDFFARRLPALVKATRLPTPEVQAAKPMKKGGRTRSTTSSPVDTNAATS